ncbi:transaldolase [Buchnera aphidicola]|uniref:Transaldolase n=1 Tax=Buchnera aphidicola (Anoecia oenotherae) TaxID=1241833 RepID=A0A4D6XPL6_9GAMM|nr:transaldolase [Buchnera aphidicola]QCI19212.1 transaldolase [Buchnera aphidicola (Anoecia oenotherae)]
MNQLNLLKKMSTIVADTSDIESIKKYKPQDATTNPSIILKSVNSNSYNHLIEKAIKYAKKKSTIKQTIAQLASDKVAINFGKEILKYIPGRISTEIDARYSFNYHLSVKKAKEIINMYEEEGIEKSKILIKLAATWEGIKATEILEKQGINCNLTLIFSLSQARIAADVGAFLISPFVGRIYDWYIQKNNINLYNVEIDPGVLSVRNIYQYYKERSYKTIIMAASFRKIEQILALSGCDYLTISPDLLKLLKNTQQNTLEQRLKPIFKKKSKKCILSHSEFLFKHNENPMAVEKLSEGIRCFSNDRIELEKIIYKKLKNL